MKTILKNCKPSELNTDCIVIGIHENHKLNKAAKELNKATNGLISKLITNGDFTGAKQTVISLYHTQNTLSKKVILVGLGKEKSLSVGDYIKTLTLVTKLVAKSGISSVGYFLSDVDVIDKTQDWLIEQQATHSISNTYQFSHKDCKKLSEKKKTINTIYICSSKDIENSLNQEKMDRGVAIGNGMNLTKELGNLPSNICTPTYLANEATRVAKKHQMDCEILEQDDIKALQMNSFLSVAKGSIEPPKFIIIKHLQGEESEAPIVLVGKGITFDTGGISIKPSNDMDEMKYDMCGAATVLGVLNTLGEIKAKVNVIGIIPTCENMPSHNAVKPGDIVKSMSGITIEILNTDAEGRLILCDALTYAERFNPKAVVDIATLTGACIVALGTHVSAVMGNNQQVIQDIINAGEDVYDRAWQLPLFDEYQEQIKSHFADIANLGSKGGGSITAACFLSRFTKKYPWVHLDIAGTANVNGAEKGATGRPVNMLVHYLLDTK